MFGIIKADSAVNYYNFVNLGKYYDEIEPKDFYRSIFPVGELEKAGADFIVGTPNELLSCILEMKI